MRHILGNKVLQYDVDDRGVIVDEREYDRTVNPKPNIADWVKEHMVFWYDISKQEATNETLKANPYLQDFSGNNRPLKLNNFLFAAMSGVGGYEYNYLDSALFITYLSGARGDGTITDNTITINNAKTSSGVIETRVNSPSKKYKVRVTGITSNETLRYVVYGDTSLGEIGNDYI